MRRQGGRSWLPVLVSLLLHPSLATAQVSPSVAATATAGASSFDVVSIKPSRPDSPGVIRWRGATGYQVQNMPLLASIMVAYLPLKWFMTRNGDDRVVNAPEWVKKERYDVVGTVAIEDMPAWKEQGLDLPVMQRMLRQALEERCKLSVHHTTQQGPVYGLVPGKRAPALKAVDPAQPEAKGAMGLPNGGRVVPYPRGGDPTLVFTDISMAEFASYLAGSANRTVVDRTGIAGRYTFSLTKRDTAGEAASDPDASSPWDLEKLGFKLVPMMAPLDTVVIDHIEKPTEN